MDFQSILFCGFIVVIVICTAVGLAHESYTKGTTVTKNPDSPSPSQSSSSSSESSKESSKATESKGGGAQW